MYHIDKEWLLDDTNDDLSVLNEDTNLISTIVSKYNLLDDEYKKFVENQINELLKMQNTTAVPTKRV